MSSNEQDQGSLAPPSTTANLAAALRALVADTQALLAATASQTGEQVAQVRAHADESLAAALVQISDTRRAAKGGVRSAAHATDAFVRSHRRGIVAASAASGFLLGAVLARQRTPRT